MAIGAHPEEHLIPFLRRELPPDEHHAVERHVATCLTCRATVSDFERLAADLARPAPPEISWGAYRAELRDKMDQHSLGQTGGRIGWLQPLRLALAGGLVAILVYVSLPGGSRVPGNGEVAAIENSILVSRLDLITRLDFVQRLDLLEDFEVIRQLDRLPRRGEG